MIAAMADAASRTQPPAGQILLERERELADIDSSRR
jgi:hypothetical protein